MIKATVVILSLVICLPAFGETINQQRAQYNYKMFCRGCHTPDGSGVQSVPELKGYMGHFLQLPEGRDYLVRVPGSANSVLDDAQLAELLNWMILEFGEDSIPENFTPYTAEEVAKLRSEPLLEVVEYRKQLVRQLRGSKE